jgi:hypothetical protein
VAGADRMMIEEVVRQVLLDEHADVIREAVKAVAAEMMALKVPELAFARTYLLRSRSGSIGGMARTGGADGWAPLKQSACGQPVRQQPEPERLVPPPTISTAPPTTNRPGTSASERRTRRVPEPLVSSTSRTRADVTSP